MFNPKYNISPKLLENIKRISVLSAQLNGRHFAQAVLAKFEKKANEISAHASTSIEGNPLPLDEVRRIIKSKPEHICNTEREVLNYNKALEELNAEFKQGGVKLDLNLILKIQKQITDGLIVPFNSGKLRQGAVVVNDPMARKIIYIPPDCKDVLSLINSLLSFVNENKKKIDPLVLAGIFHKQFVVIHPFMDGNGRTARLATKILLADLGIDTFNLFSFENYYNKNVGKYFDFAGERGDYYEIKDQIDYTLWLEYFTDGIIDELIRVGQDLKNFGIAPENILNDAQKIILSHIKENGYITDKIYSGLVKRSKPSRVNDLNKLIRLDLIERVGKGKATIYKEK